MDYKKRMERVERHILTHLDEDLSLDALADVAAFSRFHFHRVYLKMMGESVAETVRRTRLNRAAVMLATTRQEMAQVAELCGYPNTQSFARAYRAAFGEAPSQTRRSRVAPVLLLPENQGEIPMYDVDIRQEPGFHGAALAHSGPYQEIGQAYEGLIQRCLAAGLGGKLGLLVAYFWDDPTAVPADQLRSHAGVILPEGTPVPEGLDPVDVKPCEVLVVTHKGPYSGLPEAWGFMYGKALAESGRAPSEEEPPFERYLNNAMDTAPEELLTEVVMPLAR
ncbi:GyrI-like domain-containing protein [Vannielia litorea]|uniref:AraC family transcriptional regulator n=1 Tax=Vannielia litorea TaxID=1217970 RepID=UPI001C9570F2|nr:AraC family transcriptional regulator [Vannielia litorea]MBY6046040.1 AraC family transcriptional regulator [Vannielia litorea]MBY6073453.1 AraC family transcriptional regulator [Vannielia litorea]